MRLHRQVFPASTARKKLYLIWTLQLVAFVCALACIIRLV